MGKKNKDDVAKQKLLGEQQAQDRARLLAETTRAQSQQDMYNQQYGQLADVLGRESAADRALQERLMGQQFEQAGQDRGVFQSAMDRYLDQQQQAANQQQGLINTGQRQQATDRASYENLMRQSQQQSPLEQEYAGGLTDWMRFMNGGQSQTPEPAPYTKGREMAQGRPVRGLAGDGAYTPYSDSFSMPASDAIATQPNARYRDYTNAPGLIHSGLFDQAQKRREDERTALGARQFGANAMNPTLLGLQKQSMGDQASQRFGANAAKAVTDRDAQMRSEVMPYLGFNAGRQQNLLGTAAGLAGNRLSDLTNVAGQGANQIGNITGQLGNMAQGGAQNLLNLSASGARGGLGQLFGAATSGTQGLGSQLLSGAGNQSQNSTGLFTGFQVRESPSFLGQLAQGALGAGMGMLTGGLGSLGGGSFLPKSNARMPQYGAIPGVG